MKRLFDIAFSVIFATLLVLPMLAIAVLVKLTSRGPVLYWSDRIGLGNHVFRMPKFRTMRIDTPEVATHLLHDSQRWITPLGRFLRKTSLDELPQLWSILTGSMSVVGPRPALFNQDDLIRARTLSGVHTLRPGLTGWAQINGRDTVTTERKVELDTYYLEHQSIALDCQILLRTLVKVVGSEGVAQANESHTETNAGKRAA